MNISPEILATASVNFNKDLIETLKKVAIHFEIDEEEFFSYTHKILLDTQFENKD